MPECENLIDHSRRGNDKEAAVDHKRDLAPRQTLDCSLQRFRLQCFRNEHWSKVFLAIFEWHSNDDLGTQVSPDLANAIHHIVGWPRGSKRWILAYSLFEGLIDFVDCFLQIWK